MKRSFLILLAAVPVLAACQTPTAYAPTAANSRSSGFWEDRIEQHRFRVSYRGGDGTPPEQVDNFALRHAAEVTLANGDTWFLIVDRSDFANPGSSSSLSFGIGGGGFGRNGGGGIGVGTGVPLGGGPQLTSSLEITTGSGPQPPNAYNAAQVSRSLAPPPAPTPAKASG